MKQILTLIAVLFLFAVNAQSKLKPKKLIEDYNQLITELQLQHQGLYQYTFKTEVDKKLDSIRLTLNNPQTKLEFYQTLRYVIGLTNEGHTSINLPKWSMIKLGLSKSFLPLTVKYCDSNLIITQNYGKPIAGLKKSAKILKVNNKDINEILAEIYPLIPSDGFNTTSKHEWVGGINFALLYRLVFGKAKLNDLTIQNFDDNIVQTVSVKSVRLTKFKSKNAAFESQDFDYTAFEFKKINDSVGYLSIPSFGEDALDYETFYQTSFKEIDSLQIKHLILDIQANGGGTEGNENLLFSYLSDSVIQKYKQVLMLPKPYEKNKNNAGYIEDKWTFDENVAERGHYTLFSDYYSDSEYNKPKESLIYNGKLYVLTSGKTFSGGAEFASLVKMTNRGLFIGEETGGTYEGNVSGYSEYVTLEHSKIEVKIPTVHFQINVTPNKRGRGVIPDYTVPQTWGDYVNGINTKKAFAIQLINKYK